MVSDGGSSFTKMLPTPERRASGFRCAQEMRHGFPLMGASASARKAALAVQATTRGGEGVSGVAGVQRRGYESNAPPS